MPRRILMAGLFEGHDRGRFDLFAFSFGPDRNDGMRKRVAAAFDQFVDVRNRSDKDVALLSRDMGIDIAVDLKGFTQDARTGIFAPAGGAGPGRLPRLSRHDGRRITSTI